MVNHVTVCNFALLTLTKTNPAYMVKAQTVMKYNYGHYGNSELCSSILTHKVNQKQIRYNQLLSGPFATHVLVLSNKLVCVLHTHLPLKYKQSGWLWSHIAGVRTCSLEVSHHRSAYTRCSWSVNAAANSALLPPPSSVCRWLINRQRRLSRYLACLRFSSACSVRCLWFTSVQFVV